VWTTRAKSVFSAFLLGAAATFGGTGTAQAALYTGTWDPAYESIFPNLGWSASALFSVPDACLATNGNNIPVAGACAGFDVLSAKVNFYDIANPSVVLESFTLDPNVLVTGIDIAGNALAGVDTDFFHYFVPTLAIAGGGYYSFSLILYDDDAQLAYAHPVTRTPFCATFPLPGAECGLSKNPAVGTFTAVAVPEPETYLLLLAGLGAVGLSTRRRRRA
jgi:hypothetical protein